MPTIVTGVASRLALTDIKSARWAESAIGKQNVALPKNVQV